MSLFLNRIVGVAMGAALMAATAVSASAQQSRFYLPFPAKWAGRVLPPGDYRVTLPPVASGTFTLTLWGPTGTTFILPVSSDRHVVPSRISTDDYLQLVKVDGEYFVKNYESTSRAVTFSFRTPKANRRTQMAQDFTNIPVSGN